MTVETSTWTTKKGLAQMLKGGVIMDVVTPEQAKIAEDAGAVAVMALERVPSDIRATGGVARMSDPSMIVGIMDAVTIPVMAKARIGHFVEAQVLEALGVDYIDESEVLTPADEKQPHRQARLQGAVRVRLPRPRRGAAADQRGRGDDPHQGRGRHRQHRRGGAPHPLAVAPAFASSQGMREDELFVAAKELQAPYELVKDVAANGKLPVVNFVAGGIATPADAALAMQLGAEGVFVGSGIFKSEDPAAPRTRSFRRRPTSTTRKIIAEVSKGLGSADARPRSRLDARSGAAGGSRLVARTGTQVSVMDAGTAACGSASSPSRARSPSTSTSSARSAWRLFPCGCRPISRASAV